MRVVASLVIFVCKPGPVEARVAQRLRFKMADKTGKNA